MGGEGVIGQASVGENGERMGGSAVDIKEGVRQGKVSFRDKLVGETSSKSLEKADSMDVDSLVVIKGKQGDATTPSVDFSLEIREVFSQPFKEALVIKVLDKNLSYTALSFRLKNVWRLKGGYELLDVGNGYFLVKFNFPEERDKVLTGGPWILNGNYVAVKPWSPTFRSGEDTFGETMVWIRISGLPIWYYHEKLMSKIAAAIGDPIKIDLATKSAERGRYARACIKINLGCPVVRKVKVDGIEYEVEYESLNLICQTCDCYGHVVRDCSKKKELWKNAPPEVEHVNQDLGGPTVEGIDQGDELKEKPFKFGENHGNVTKKSILTDNQENKLDTANSDVNAENQNEGWQVINKKGKAVAGSGNNDSKMRGAKAICSNRDSKTQGKYGKRSNGPRNNGIAKAGLESSSSFQQKSGTPFVPNNHKRPRPGSLQNSPLSPVVAPLLNANGENNNGSTQTVSNLSSCVAPSQP